MRRHLESLLLDGKLALGDRIPLARLAADLEVSVTPVREALSQLEHAGIVTSIPNRGFFIGELSATEARQIYPIIASLEAMLVGETTYSAKDLERLAKRQDALESATRPLSYVRADLAFHEALLRPSTNPTACRIVEELKLRVFFYEVAYWSRTAEIDLSFGHHRRLLDRLTVGDAAAAAEIVRDNWLQSLTAVDEQLQTRPQAN